MQNPTSPNTSGAAPRPRLRFGIFDWLDAQPDRDQAALYDDRLRMLEYADTAGFYCYHLAEHHWTPLCTAPSPNLFLAAAAQRTSQIRLGPLVYLLPLYHPLRLLEEIAMLDQLTHGRLDVGVGRGASPYEIGPFGVPTDELREMFAEALAILVQGLSTGAVDYQGRYYSYTGVRATLRPLQQPYPPLWYPTNYTTSIPWIGQHGFSTVFGALFPSLEATGEQFRIYNEQRAAHRDDPDRLNGHVADPCYGIVRHVYVADTDEQALQEARAAYADFFHSFGYLWAMHGEDRHLRRGGFDAQIEQGGLYVGSPATVGARLQDALDVTGSNYFAGAFAFGSLTADQTLRSLRLFTEEIIPSLTLSPRGSASG